MKAHTTLLAAVASALISTTVAAAPTPVVEPTLRGEKVSDETPWIADFDVAVKRAQEEGKDLLIDFTGSDWCSWCIKLHDEVFAHEEFLAYASKKYVLVALDYPRNEEAKSRVPNPARNEELRSQYKVNGFPTILLMTPEGDVFGKTGYQPGGPDAYVAHLTKLRDEGLQALTDATNLVQELEAAEGAAQVEVLSRILTVIEGLSPDSPIVGRLEAPARIAFTIDPDNAQGLKLRAVKALLKAGLNDADLANAARELDPKNESGLLELVVFAEFSQVQEDADLSKCCDSLDALLAVGTLQAEDKALFMLVNAAIWNEQYLKDLERAKKYAALALDREIDDPNLTARLKQILGE